MKEPRPNILLIVADDLGYGDFGVFSEGRTATPALDSLIADGVCLTQHYSASPICAPARASLLTGRYPHRTGAIDVLENRGLDRIALRETTIGDLFRRAGYTTALIGKWHNGALDARYHPQARGFEEFVGFRGGWQDYYDWNLEYGTNVKKSDGRYLTDVFTDEAIGFLRRRRTEPFFLCLTYNAPHIPFQVPDEELKPILQQGRFNKGVSHLYAMIRRLDRGIERINEELARLGLEENTVVLFTSDNGPRFLGEGEWSTTRFNCGFNGCKLYVYEGGIRVPMVIRWPAGGYTGGRRTRDFVHFTDWLPTLCALADVDCSGTLPLDGEDVTGTLSGDRGTINPRRFWQYSFYVPMVGCNAAMRDGYWKLVRPAIREAMEHAQADIDMVRSMKYHPDHHAEIRRDPLPERWIPDPAPPQLYNLREDPEERYDLSADEPERTSRMLRELETWFEAVEADRRLIRE